jgi:hypothetical protein
MKGANPMFPIIAFLLVTVCLLDEEKTETQEINVESPLTPEKENDTKELVEEEKINP